MNPKRWRKLFLTSMFVILGLMFFTKVNAALLSTINYQAYLTNDQDIPIDGNRSITFRLYTVATGGSFFWEESQTVNVSKGLLSIELGSELTSPLSLNLTDSLNPFHGPLILGVQIGSDSEMTPHKAISLISFAVKAEDANTLEGINAADLDDMDELINHSMVAGSHHYLYRYKGNFPCSQFDI